MYRVLIVDDEPRYHDHLGRVLERRGWEVQSAADPHAAIGLGCRFRPNVLIADWMLGSELHGLHVSEALRAIDADLRTIVMTGYASADLREQAAQAAVAGFLEKPFEPEALVRAVESAIAGPAAPGVSPVAFFAVDGDGNVLRATPAARGLLDSIGNVSVLVLAGAESAWQVLGVAVDEPLFLRTRREATTGGWVGVLARGAAERDARVLAHLIALRPSPAPGRLPGGRVLVLSVAPEVRLTATRAVEELHSVCHVSSDAAAARRILERDPGVDLVIVDGDELCQPIVDAVQVIRAARSAVQVVGTSRQALAAEFARAGVRLFLRKPWVAADLADVLLDRIEKCVDCGLRLPLRRPQRAERGEVWRCRMCGSRYVAIQDESRSDVPLENATRESPNPASPT